MGWTAPDTTGEPPVKRYELRYQKDGETDSWVEQSQRSRNTEATVAGLERTRPRPAPQVAGVSSFTSWKRRKSVS